tara:strand:+ start:13878 stop:15182 length:1305 start_codon:yes stop_codon:yes gene_type:complete
MEEIDLKKLNKNRIEIKEVFSGKKKIVEIVGWVHNTRDLSKIKFILLRDTSGIIQITGVKGKTSKSIFENMEKVSRESLIYVKGKVVNSKQAPGGKEINPDKIIIISEADDLPIDVSDYSKTELPKRLDHRFLDLHRKRTQTIFKIQGEIAKAFRDYFYDKGFIEMQPPCIIGSSSEGGTDLFPVKYFEKNAYLAQSPQLYKQMVACSIEKTFMITPIWRAEKHNTIRHINEVRMMDIEVAFYDQMLVMKLQEEVMKYIINYILKNCKSDLDFLGVKLKIPKAKYISYDETIKLLKMNHGHDLTPENEKQLDKLFPDTIVFIHSWPVSLKPFYIMPKDQNSNSKLSEGFDAIYKGVELSSGGQRIHLPELLEKMIKKKGLKIKDFKSYIDSFKFGAPPHAGWSIGLERITMELLGIDNIREATLFPRDRDRLNP